MNAETVRAGLARLREDGPEAVTDLLDPNVEMLGPQASPWDCHGRAEVIRFLYHFEPGGTALERAFTDSRAHQQTHSDSQADEDAQTDESAEGHADANEVAVRSAASPRLAICPLPQRRRFRAPSRVTT